LKAKKFPAALKKQISIDQIRPFVEVGLRQIDTSNLESK